ncbi:beta galactosidase [Trichuris trichiura]|uniref:Beta-galactosidase n=1 Tax=Trichuris trichiura TaxID=36087 RepID=A0A077Z195_TRITR|nr:beta galactosidase [Trichuris trichiura]
MAFTSVFFYHVLAQKAGLTADQERSFSIDYNNNQFLKDGMPYRYIAGAVHYFRIPEIYWYDRLKKVRAAGLNAIQTYVPWNLHEPFPGKFYFSNMANLTEFLFLANKLNLSVILRPGPFICAEWENGGLPWWLLNEPDIRLRTSDPKFMWRVQLWYAELMPKIIPFLYRNGGPIIMVQIENEYGSYKECDQTYTASLASLFRVHLGPDVTLFTTDGHSLKMVKCGSISVYPTVDFGPMNFQRVREAFAIQRYFAPKGPLVNSEFYAGWFDEWGRNHSVTLIKPVLETMEYMWILNASFTIYVFHGGSNFGFMSGISALPVTTSYDYDAPLNEAGDITPKYLAIRAQIERLTGVSNLYPLPPANIKIAYGTLKLRSLGTLVSLLNFVSPMKRVISKRTQSFESLNWPYGTVLYEARVPFSAGKYVLKISGLKDLAYVIVDGQLQGTLMERKKQEPSMDIQISDNSTLQILVENLGRQTFGYVDKKGILGNVSLSGAVLTTWIHYRISIEALFNTAYSYIPATGRKGLPSTPFTPTIYTADFLLGSSIEDTFFYPKGWGKGQLYLNGHNVGRYWPRLGPQLTLYVPKNMLRQGNNRAIILEYENPGQCVDQHETVCAIQFIDFPLLSKPVSSR